MYLKSNRGWINQTVMSTGRISNEKNYCGRARRLLKLVHHGMKQRWAPAASMMEDNYRRRAQKLLKLVPRGSKHGAAQRENKSLKWGTGSHRAAFSPGRKSQWGRATKIWQLIGCNKKHKPTNEEQKAPKLRVQNAPKPRVQSTAKKKSKSMTSLAKEEALAPPRTSSIY